MGYRCLAFAICAFILAAPLHAAKSSRRRASSDHVSTPPRAKADAPAAESACTENITKVVQDHRRDCGVKPTVEFSPSMFNSGKPGVEEISGPDLLLLFSKAIWCTDSSALNRSLQAYLEKEETRNRCGAGPVLRSYYTQLREMRDIPGLAESIGAQISARHAYDFAAEKCKGKSSTSLTEGVFYDRVMALRKKIQRRTLRSLKDLYKGLDTDEKAIVSLMFLDNSRESLPLIDFALGTDQANYFRNLLILGPLPPDSQKKAQKFSEAVAKVEAIQKGLPAQRLIELRAQRQVFLKALDAGEIEVGNDAASLLAADKIRTQFAAQIAQLDNRLPTKTEQKEAADNILEAEGKQARSSLFASQPAIDPSQGDHALRRQQLSLLAREKPQSCVVPSRSDGGRLRSPMDEFLGKLEGGHRAVESGILGEVKDANAAFFYGAALKKERSARLSERELEAQKNIEEGFSRYGLSLTADDRRKLEDSLSPFYQSLLGEMVKHAGTETSKSLQKEGRQWLQPTIFDLSELVFNPKGAEKKIRSWAMASQLAQADPEALFTALKPELDLAQMKYLEQNHLGKISQLDPYNRQNLLSAIEGRLDDPKSKHAADTKMALMMAAQLLREWKHPVETLFPALTPSNPASVTQTIDNSDPALHEPLHYARKALHNEAPKDTESKRAAKVLEEARATMAKQGYGLPLPSEISLLHFLRQKGTLGEESISSLVAEMPAKDFAETVASLQPLDDESTHEALSSALHRYLPSAQDLQADPQVTAERHVATAVQELIHDKQLSDRSLGFILSALPKFPACGNDEAGNVKDLQQPQEVDDVKRCLFLEIHNQAASVLIEGYKVDQAKKLLNPYFTSKAALDKHVSSLVNEKEARFQLRKQAQKKNFKLDDLLPIIANSPDQGSAAEAKRRNEVSGWNASARLYERSSESARSNRQKALIDATEAHEDAEGQMAEIEQKRRGALSRLTDAQYKRWDELDVLSRRLREKAPEPPKVQTLNQKVESHQKSQTGDYQALKARIAEVEKEKAALEEAGKTPGKELQLFSEAEQKLYDLQRQRLDVAASRLNQLTNPQRQLALAAIQKYEQKNDPLIREGDEGPLDEASRLYRAFNEVAGDDTKPLFVELEGVIKSFAQKGELTDKDGKPLDLAAQKRLASSLLAQAGAKVPEKALVSEQIKKILGDCAARPKDCGLSSDEIEGVKKLYQDHVASGAEGEKNLDKPGTHDSAEESQSAQDKEQIHLAALRQKLLQYGRNSEYRSNLQEREEQIKALGDKIGDGGAVYVASLVERLDRAKSIAATVANSKAALEPLPSTSGAELDRWIEKSGFAPMIKSWVWENSSGMEVHKIPEAEAKRLFAKILGDEITKAKEERFIRDSMALGVKKIISPNGEHFGGGDLWNWKTAKLHLLGQPGYPTQEQFLRYLDEYAEHSQVNDHALKPEFAVDKRGRDEFYDQVHRTFMASGYKRDATALNSHSWVALTTDPSTEKEGYRFSDFASARPKMEELAKSVRRRLANNSQVLAQMSKQGGSLEGLKRIWTGRKTQNDEYLETLLDSIAVDLAEMTKLGDAPIDYNGISDVSIGEVARSLRKEFSSVLKHQKAEFANIDRGYEQGEEAVKVSAGMAASYLLPGAALAGLSKIRRGASYLKMARTAKALKATEFVLRSALLRTPKTLEAAYKLGPLKNQTSMWALAKLLGKGRESYNMAKLALKGAGFSAATAAGWSAYNMPAEFESANAIDKLDADCKPGSDGVPDWQNAQTCGVSYFFPKEIAVVVDKDNNGVPDLHDMAMRGLPPETYLAGALTDLYDGTKDSMKVMALAPWASSIVGRTLLRPAGRMLVNKGYYSAPVKFKMWEMTGGMFATKMAQRMLFADEGLNWKENLARSLSPKNVWNNSVDSFFDSVFMSPFDDLLALKAMKANPNLSMSAIRGIKGLVNHGFDYGQGALNVWRQGEYRNAAGFTTKNPWLAGALNMGESFYQSAKASDPKNAQFDLMPKIVAERILAASARGDNDLNDPLLDFKLTGQNGQAVPIRELITQTMNMEDVVDPKYHRAFLTLFTKKLMEKGVPEEQVGRFFERALDRAKTTNPIEMRFGEVDNFLGHIAQERKIEGLLDGSVEAKQLIASKNVWGGSAQLHHWLIAGDLVDQGSFKKKFVPYDAEVKTAQGTVEKERRARDVGREIQIALQQTAQDYGIDYKEFSSYVLRRTSDPSDLAASMPIGALAKAFKDDKWRAARKARAGRP